MINSLKQNIIIAFAYGVLQMILNVFFGSYQFLNEEISLVIYLFSILFVVAILQFTYLNFLVPLFKNSGYTKLVYCGSFIGVSFFSSLILWLIFSIEKNHFFLYLISLLIASFLPTLVFLLYLIFVETKEKFSIATFGQSSSEEDQKTFRLENTSGKLLLEVEIDKIVCFEANDNYVVTYFLRHEDELSKSMERISLKKIEEMLEQEGIKFERVHKSYLINPFFFDEVKGKAQAYKIKMKHFKTLVPVSRSYDVSIFNKQF